jgi:hypothetical protein
MLNLDNTINQLGGDKFLLEFVEYSSPIIRENFLPSLLYTHESIFEANVCKETKKKMIQTINEANHIVGYVFDKSQINLLIILIVNATIEKLKTNRHEFNQGEMLNTILNDNRENPTVQTKEFVLVSMSSLIHEDFITCIEDHFIEKQAENDKYLLAVVKDVFSYELVKRVTVNVIDLFDEYIFDRI